jgi:L-seryl-tRNA(Ser) seleniumtransferase
LILGRADLIEACRLNGSPNPSIGRPMKVGKEESIGALAAVDWSLKQDETELLARYETMVHGWIEDLGRLKGVSAERVFPSEAGQPMPRTLIRLLDGGQRRRDAVIASLREGDVRVEVGTESAIPDGILLNPQTLEPGEEEIVAARLREAIDRASS